MLAVRIDYLKRLLNFANFPTEDLAATNYQISSHFEHILNLAGS